MNMMRMGLVLALALVGDAQGQPLMPAVGCDVPQSGLLGPQLGQVIRDKRPVPVYAVGTPILGVAGESMDDLAERASVRFREFTAQTQRESCAEICQSTSGATVYGLVPTTSLSAGSCPVTTVCPDGMTPTKETIHTHGAATRFTVCDTDRALMGWLYSRGEIVEKEKPEAFSSEDFDGGIGYMVSPTTLWHQSGRGQVRQVQPAPIASDGSPVGPGRTRSNPQLPSKPAQ